MASVAAPAKIQPAVNDEAMSEEAMIKTVLMVGREIIARSGFGKIIIEISGGEYAYVVKEESLQLNRRTRKAARQ